MQKTNKSMAANFIFPPRVKRDNTSFAPAVFLTLNVFSFKMWIHGQKLLRLKHFLLRVFNTARYQNGAALNDALFYLHKNENHEYKISLKQNSLRFSKCLPVLNWQLKAHIVTRMKYILPTWNKFQTRFAVSFSVFHKIHTNKMEATYHCS